MRRAQLRHCSFSTLIFKHNMNVDQGDFGTAVAPEQLSTTGLGPCIGAALIYQQRGFVMHAQHAIIERETLTNHFFTLLDQHIPAAARASVTPVLVGGSIEDDEPGEAPGLRIADCRLEIVSRFADKGFAAPVIRWCGAHEIHSLHLDLVKEVIFLETNDINRGGDTSFDVMYRRSD